MIFASSAPLEVSKCPGTNRIFEVLVSAGIRRKLRSFSVNGCMPSAYAPDVLTRAMRQSFKSRLNGVYGIQLREISNITLEFSSTRRTVPDSSADRQSDVYRCNESCPVYR